MLNRAINPILDLPNRSEGAGAEIDRSPAFRLTALFCAVAVALGCVGLRLAYVQSSLGSLYAAEFDVTTEKREAIPSRDGRILSADGQVLAEDVDQFALKVHYRWLEEPPDSHWLKQQAFSRLDRTARRNPQKVADAEAEVLARRSALWERLTHATGQSPQELSRRRRAIQERVERIYNLVEARRQEREEERAPSQAPADSLPAWEQIWQQVVRALTTAPRREEVEPLVIAEQLDYHPLLVELPVETAVEIEAHPERYPGTRVETTTRRIYPQESAASHLIGYRTPLDDDALRDRRKQFPEGDPLDYRTGDRLGRAGLEKYYERHLRGLRGERRVVFNRRGELIQSEVVREPRFGRDLVLSLQLPLQRAAEQLLDDVLAREHLDETNGKPLPIPPGGVIVALDVRTGAVLAAASAPRFDLRLFSEPDGAKWQETIADPRKPLFHRAAEMTLPPGSTFKVVSAVAFLESGRFDPDALFHCQGFLDTPERYRCFTFRNFGVGHGDLNLAGALARSCNVYFFAGARRLGAAPLIDWGSRFGFGRPTGIDLPAESSGILPAEPAASAKSRRGSSSGEALQLAIGQGKLTATPLQVARMMAAVANGGKLITPHLADSAGPTIALSADAAEESLPAAPATPIADLSLHSLEWVRQGLQQVVAHPQGTGYKTVRLNGVRIAGKTGTAEPGGGRADHAWFAGYVPAERPRIAFVVVLEHAGAGGHAAGPLAREFVEALLALGLLNTEAIAPPSAN